VSGRSSTPLRHANQKGADVQSMNILGVKQYIHHIHLTPARGLCSTQPQGLTVSTILALVFVAILSLFAFPQSSMFLIFNDEA
jgi:hypothetical protein